MSRDYTRRSQPRSYSKKAKKSGGNKSTFFGVIIGLILALIGWYYAPVITEKLSNIKLHRPGEVHEHSAGKKEKLNTVQSAPPKPKSAAPEFDFYTVLPKDQVDSAAVVNAAAKKPASAPAPAANPAADTISSSITAAQTQLTNPSAATAPTSAKPPAAETTPVPPAAASTTAPAIPSAKPPAPVEVAQPAQRFTLQVASLKNYADADSLKAQLTMLGFDVAIQKYTVNNQMRYRVFAGSYTSRSAAQKQQAALKENGISSILVKQ